MPLLISRTARNKLLIIALSLVVIVGIILFFSEKSAAPAVSPKQPAASPTTQPKTEPATSTAFDTKQYSIDDPASIWVIANKQRPLQPKTYTPGDLRVPSVALRSNATSDEMKMRDSAATALEQMFMAAKNEGLSLLLASGYRSYNLQVGVYNHNVREVGQAEADIRSARPGHSEHQTGLAVDVGAASRQCEIEECFSTLPEGKWVAANAYRFGFVIRYPQNKQGTTGYVYEPWHIRFVGTTLSNELQQRSYPTLEDFFNLPAAPNY